MPHEIRTITLQDAATQLGIGKTNAYALAQRGEFPVPVIRAGRRYVVPREPLERLLAGETSPRDAA
jgi:excisionase family DNA binding protein